MSCWLPIPPDSDFSRANLPYGVCRQGEGHRVVVAVGDAALDLHRLASLGLLNLPAEVLNKPRLNEFIALGSGVHRETRAQLQELLEGPRPSSLTDDCLLDRFSLDMVLPVQVGDYVDFYSSLEHATNVGTMFRGPENALPPNWRHLPIGYHGRSSTLFVSGTEIPRPWGQVLKEEEPEFSPSGRLDFELEVGLIVGRDTSPGQRLTPDEAEEAIFGLVLVNDWSARDIQRWEYVPLGPFLGKSFATTISPWVVTMAALEPFRIEGPEQNPLPLPHLQTEGPRAFDIPLEVELTPQGGLPQVISRSNFRYLYWSMAQQLAHLTSNGTVLRVGDLCASGTISGPYPGSRGCLLELSWNGRDPLELEHGMQRTFLEDGDSVALRGRAGEPGGYVGFGEAEGTIRPPL